jgi:hypothetical protein
MDKRAEVKDMVKRLNIVAGTLLLAAILHGQSGDDFLLSPGKAGRIEIGMAVDKIYSVYTREATKLVDLALEGFFTPALEITLPGHVGEKPSITAEIGWSQAWTFSRITVYDSRFRTASGIGAGSSLGEIRRNHKVDWIEFGEGPMVARVDSLGMGFLLEVQAVPQAWYEKRDMKWIPDSAKVTGILVN